MPGGQRPPSRPELTQELLDDAVIRLWLRSRITESECWVTDRGWTTGYSQVSIKGVPHLAHRVAYIQKHGPIPKHLTDLDHFKCQNRACWNPDHVEPVTHEENMARWREIKYGSRDLPPIWVREPGHSTDKVREWRANNREHDREWNRQYREKNREKINARTREWKRRKRAEGNDE